MKFDIYFTLRGAGGEAEAPNKNNPVECADLHDCLTQIGAYIGPTNPGQFLEYVGVRIEEHKP